ncbi:1,4-alpha-glucan branching protein [Streptomyces sp. NPDC059002]|uniref:maltokinase N-terminal cap-like domain-containing protein n=1 Tax=Streptomyces sp. NPDC059002 TaxID=3346690 RepID=UPI00369F6F5F
MAVIHHTALKPNKLELLNSWLPSRPWYQGGAGGPELTKSGGFRLDDPRGEVGLEFMVVTDAAGPAPVTYLVPLTYRGAPLEGAERALVGTMEHGVLGRRWAYDGCQDPVAVGQLLALIEGRVQAQDQNASDVVDRDVIGSCTGDGSVCADFAAAVTAADDREGTELTAPHGAILRLHRVLRTAPDGQFPAPQGAVGTVVGSWSGADGAPARGMLAALWQPEATRTTPIA